MTGGGFVEPFPRYASGSVHVGGTSQSGHTASASNDDPQTEQRHVPTVRCYGPGLARRNAYTTRGERRAKLDRSQG